MSRLSFFLGAVLLMSTSPVLAGGFLIYEHGAIATGMADARTALADDVSALYYNPSAITELPGLQLQLGATGILPLVSFEAAEIPGGPRTYPIAGGGTKEVDEGYDAEAKTKLFTPIHVYASYRFANAPVAVGFSLNNPFGLGTFWPGEWDGRFINTETEIHTFFSQPVAALDLAEAFGFKRSFKLSVAAGFNFVYATARLGKRIDLRVAEAFYYPEVQDPWGEMSLTGDAVGYGWNLALYAELPGLVSLGASLRSGVGLSFSGTAEFTFNPAGRIVVDRLLSIPNKTNGEVTINLPMNMNFGLALLAVDRLKLALDVYIALFQSYDELDIHFSCLDQQENRCDDLDTDPIPKNWGTSSQIALGAEYQLTDRLAVRAGYGLVFSPVPSETYDPALPDGRRDLFCLGGGYQGSWWKVDLGYMLALWQDVKDNDVGREEGGNPNGKANGTYTTVAHLLAMSLSMKFF